MLKNGIFKALAFVALVSFAACGGQAEETPAPGTPAAEEPVAAPVIEPAPEETEADTAEVEAEVEGEAEGEATN